MSDAHNELPSEFPVQPPKNPWRRISEIAERLNVKPRTDISDTIAITSDGKSYDLWEIVAAMLDRLDEIEERII